MAKNEKTAKEPGRIKQLFELYKLTAQKDKMAPVIAIGAFVLVAAASIVLPAIFAPGNVLTAVIYGVLGVSIAFLLGLILMSRRAEAVAYGRIEGQPGAVGAVLQNGFRGGWVTSEVPVGVNPKTKDLVYRIIGPAGIVIIAEGSGATLQTLVNDEKRKLSKVAHGVPTHVVYVGTNEGQVRLANLRKTVVKLKREVKRNEIHLIDQRLSTLGMNNPIPKGIDPNKLRSMRGQRR